MKTNQLLLTNQGLFLPDKFTLQSTLAITNRVERDFIVFDDFKAFFSWVKANCIKEYFEENTIGKNGIYVGYMNKFYITNFGILTYGCGIWMDDYINWKHHNQNVTYLSQFSNKNYEV